MKKIMALTVAAIMMLSLAACGSPEEVQPEEQVDYEIAMVTEAGLIMNGGYSEVAWNTISSFGEKKGVSHKYYKAAEASEDAYRQVIDNAVDGGAKLVVADGYLFSQVVYEKQKEYPDVKFVLIDAAPMDEESGEVKVAKNTVEVAFASEQAGYLAGYAAVKEGMSSLGYLGDSKVPLAMDYGYGFLQGADKAAGELGRSVNVAYRYSNSKEDSEAVRSIAKQWYEGDTEVIFACGNKVEFPVIEAAEMTNKKVIGYETDKSRMSDTVVTSAVKEIGTALESVLDQYEDDKFPGGTTIEYTIENNGVRLEMDNAKLENFSKSDYNDIVKKMKNGDISIKKYDSGDIASLGLSHVKVTEQ